jgi:hypothetical protein
MSGPGSAAAALQAALVTGIAATGLPAFDAVPVRGSLPHAVVEPPLLRSRDAAGADGAEGRVTVAIHDQGERPVRLWALVGGVEAALAAVMPELTGGWRLVVAEVGVARVRRGENLRWVAAIEMRVRMYRVN